MTCEVINDIIGFQTQLRVVVSDMGTAPLIPQSQSSIQARKPDRSETLVSS